MSQELFVSVSQLMSMSNAKGIRYDHVVIESSGISEPKSVRSVFQDAESYGVKLMDEVGLRNSLQYRALYVIHTGIEYYMPGIIYYILYVYICTHVNISIYFV